MRKATFRGRTPSPQLPGYLVCAIGLHYKVIDITLLVSCRVKDQGYYANYLTPMAAMSAAHGFWLVDTCPTFYPALD
jgi:hypothetical protein